MSKTEIILTNIPLIIDLTKAKFSLSEICNILKTRNNIDINYDTLRSLLSLIRTNKIHPEYDKLVLIQTEYHNVQIFEPYSIKFHNFWICFNTSNFKDEWKITEKSLTNIPNPIGLLYAKRLLKLYHISDKYLLDNYLKTFGIKITPDEQAIINNISANIKPEYDKIISELKRKNLEYILGIHK